ncbi:hypothetical protein DBR44_16245 [Aquitalea sp. FJL05]|uniref:hypothetical protein n=1 Tax=Aquitalea sp. FJL05 TaxID=2153366 RepID=UPI000F59A9CD|nr:hypothetical protein [Aquitalea sp. FJL05]RQO68223.1 hypothetical protein DBR44_16245 [Aquitalea sp. FJL05]
MRSIIFLKPHGIYTPGDIAGFADEVRAGQLVESGIATDHTPEGQGSTTPANGKKGKPAADADKGGG